MDPRRFLSVTALSAAVAFGLSGCALLRGPDADPIVFSEVLTPEVPTPEVAPEPLPSSEWVPATPPIEPGSTARPYLEAVVQAEPPRRRRAETPAPETPSGRAAIAEANRSARAASSADGFVGGVQVFGWSDGRVYEVWTAPLRVTTLTLAPGETVTAKAAGDTVRWQIGESQSGAGASARTHVLIKPLQAGLETNLVLTTSQRVYLLTLRSGAADAFNAAIAWDYGFAASSGPVADPLSGLPPVDVQAATPQGPLDARYRIEARGRSPRWAPTAVFNDGARTFITMSPGAAIDEVPALFVRAGEDLQLVNYRQADGVLIVDRLFDEAELRLGDRRPQIVRIRRIPGAAR
ncbi:TrbG/VirB9 family P-type conjugative transfer protein [Brevundimonas sp. UBA5936]|jgi:P-type conjugative transfer protein TrbG|uniref:TrbG/VirB9 family P-type conjugative transfer protein n=1 Tax=Brevundimonas sp. UBA5936 TaxID=1946133 RepID=UPI0025B952F1|nr:TrbG/VirB9 family P-type conjugative transfer protein [Brevundimonas sp. UBA5936]